MTLFDSLLNDNFEKRKRVAVLSTNAVSIPLIILSIYGIREYGVALFIFVPLLVGILSSSILGYQNQITRKQARNIAFITLFTLGIGLMIFAIEGLICILMAAPFALLLTWVGSLIGHVLVTKNPRHSINSIILTIILIPLTAFTEKDFIPATKPVKTKVLIHSTKEIVWNNVISFPKLNQPSELLFKMGISYPVESTIKGQGVGAVRYCTFNTGEFVEPITEWKENEILQFDVIEQPVPLREISFWDINAPHLHDYFVSKKGQFKITELENGAIELEGTTWYYHNIKPDFYWRLWSDYIIHKIHLRVLHHIKEVSEKAV